MSASPSPSSVPPAAGHAAEHPPAGDGSPVGVTLLVFVGSIVAFAALALRGPGDSGATAQSARAIATALREAVKPVKASQVEEACERPDCNCIAIAALLGVDVAVK